MSPLRQNADTRGSRVYPLPVKVEDRFKACQVRKARDRQDNYRNDPVDNNDRDTVAASLSDAKDR